MTPNPTTLTFTTSNWNTPRTVTVTAAADTDLTNDTVELTHRRDEHGQRLQWHHDRWGDGDGEATTTPPR